MPSESVDAVVRATADLAARFGGLTPQEHFEVEDALGFSVFPLEHALALIRRHRSDTHTGGSDGRYNYGTHERDPLSGCGRSEEHSPAPSGALRGRHDH
jgi:hypothetical protein